jgi:hypothetical protein
MNKEQYESKLKQLRKTTNYKLWYQSHKIYLQSLLKNNESFNLEELDELSKGSTGPTTS